MPSGKQWGICDYITKPRVAAAITGKTPDGEPIKGDYKFTDEFPMAEGFEENAEFFTLTYETPVAVSHNRAFARIAPLLWLRAGSRGGASTSCPPQGWAVADTYGLLIDLDQASRLLQGSRADTKACGSPSSSPTTTGAFRRLPAACPTGWSRSGCTSPTSPISASPTGTKR